MTEREQLLIEVGKLSFAAWDIGLFLDTHPFNTEAIACRRYYVSMAKTAKDTYEKTYGPLTSAQSTSECCWDWIEGSWPWESEE